MYAVIVRAEVHPDHRDAYLSEILAHASRSLSAEPGTQRFDVVQDETAPNRVYLYEAYADRAAFAAHGQGDSIQRFRAATSGITATIALVGRGESVMAADASE